jgi:phospholipid/cholesterol/gamma-HCH transport system permease protein
MTASVTAEPLTVETERREGGLRIALAGRLDASTLPVAWNKAVVPIHKKPPANITVDAGKLTYCDGAGLGLFAELRRLAATAGGDVAFENLSPELERLVKMSLLQDATAKGLKERRGAGFVTEVGETVANVVKDQRQLVAFIGMLSASLVWAVFHPRRIRYGDLALIARKAGADAVPVVGLLGFLVGIILSFQMASPLEQYGAQNLIAKIVSFSLIRELGPLITAIILSGRSGAAFAAEIGTMKVTEELAALETMGLDPGRFLVVPRVLAALIVTPLLAAVNILMGLIGGAIIMVSLGYTLTFYISSVRDSISVTDMWGGLFKALVFGLIVAGVGCLRGTQTKSGPGAVGDSTTRAVVAGIVLTIVADAILGTIYFKLKI